jgi:chromosome segregation ATPase
MMDQFDLLEQKIEFLVEMVKAFKQENTDLLEKLRVQEETLDNLSKELASLKPEREWERQRIVTLLEKIEQSSQILDVTLEAVKKKSLRIG